MQERSVLSVFVHETRTFHGYMVDRFNEVDEVG